MLGILLSSFIFSTYICTDANVAIQRQNKEYADCGRSLTLTCNIQKYDFAMSWLTGNDTIKIAKCIENNCDQNPIYFGKYNFTFDVERGVFNLTIVKLTTEDNGRVFVCSDGTDVDTRLIKIRGYEPMLLENIGAGRVMATSGCVSNVTQVSFRWIKISTINGIEEEFIPTIKSNYSSKCSNESDCWIDGRMQYNVIIQASQSDNGQYYLKMIAIYGNELKISSNTTYKYIIKGQGDEDEDHDISPQHLAIIIMVAVSIFLLYLASIWSSLRRKISNRTSTRNGKSDYPHEIKELVKKTLQPANTYQIERSFHNKWSLRNCRSGQASSEGNTDIDEHKSDLLPTECR